MKKAIILSVFLCVLYGAKGQDIVYGNYSGYSHRVSTSSGYVDIGPKNGGWAHIYTDRPGFIFNKPVYSYNGVFSAYSNSDLHLQVNGITRIHVSRANGNVTINKNLLINGADLKLGLNSGRDKGQNTLQRALVHNTSDRLFINYLGDFEGGVVIQGPKSTFDGKVGVGTTLPEGKLHVATNEDAISWSVFNNMRNNATLSGYGVGIKLKHSGSSEQQKWSGIASIQESSWANNSGLALYADGREYMRIRATGNVGIGTDSPTEKLSVNGVIRAKEILVEASPWPDYVFEKDHNLISLHELEEFIEKEGHLPHIPSAEEIEMSGVTLGKMNALLVEKIEELTLYLLEQNTRIEKLESDNQYLIQQLSNQE